MGTPEIAAYIAPVRQSDGAIVWQIFQTQEEAIAADYRTKEIEDLKADAGRRGKSFMEERNALTRDLNGLVDKLAEQQQLNAQLRQALADTTSHVLTLCKALGRLMG